MPLTRACLRAQRIVVGFYYVDVERNGWGCNDRVLITDPAKFAPGAVPLPCVKGSNAPYGAQYEACTGKNAQAIFDSVGNELYVDFCTNTYVSGRGFRLRWTSIAGTSWACNGR